MKHILVYNNQTGIMDALKTLFFTEEIEIVPIEDAILLEDDIVSSRADMLIIDSFLVPEDVLEGLELIRRMRRVSKLPIIVVSQPVEERIKIEALEAGADDYVTSDDNPLVLLAKVKMHLARYRQLVEMQQNISRIYRVDHLVVDDGSRKVMVNKEEIDLTPIEYKILCLLLKGRGKVFSACEIYEAIWNAPPLGAGNTIPVHVRHIREKIEENPKQPKYLKAVWGLGYKIG